MSTLAGILCVRNGDDLDYCWREAGESLLGVCDELVLSDCDSEDGTRSAMDEWAAKEPRITLCNFPWTKPVANTLWYPEWLNYARQHAKSEHIIHLDADEIIHEDDYELIRRAAENRSTLYLKRLNFWRDAYHLIPEGQCLGTKVLRIAPKNMPIPSDYPYAPAEATMRQAVDSAIRVFHYGFLRERKAMEKKAETVHVIWSGKLDDRLKQAFESDSPWMENAVVSDWIHEVTEYHGTHPIAAQAWLLERGWKLK